ncbi:MAG: MBL fold metallo-hydrolase [Rhodospirillaceae bacterium]|nr:MBL fold metallo-hydrolase [Rhodospirillaceae bacterium]
MRALCVAAVLALFSGAVAAQTPSLEELKKPAPNPAWNKFGVRGYETVELAPGLYTFGNGGARNIFLVTSDGVIATDPVSPAFAKEMRAAIRKVTNQPVKYVVYSHQHWDHVLGGKIFKDEGAVFISHEKCVEHFKDLPNADLVMPDFTFSNNYRLTLGGRTLDMLYFGKNHGDCLVVMRPDPGRIFFMPDLVTAGGLVGGTMNDYSLHNMVRTLKELEAMDFDYLVGGHGVPLAHKSAVNERRRYLEALMAAVKEALDQGKSFDEIHKSVRLKEFDYMRNYKEFIERNVYRTRVYWEMGW